MVWTQNSTIRSPDPHNLVSSRQPFFSLKLDERSWEWDGDHGVPDGYLDLLWYGLEAAPTVPVVSEEEAKGALHTGSG